MSIVATPTTTINIFGTVDKDMDVNTKDDTAVTFTPPRIFCTLPPLLLKQNHPASIPIRVTGFPNPEIYWFVKGIPAEETPGYKVSTGPGRKSHPEEILTVLEISSVSHTLEGGVEVMAQNHRGTDRFVVPLKTYRLLSGIYLEDDIVDSKKAKGFEGGRTIDRKLFQNEVDEACRGIKIYQAYCNVSKSSHDFGRDDDPATREWRHEMARRNLMKSIDDIIDNFNSKDDCDDKQFCPKPKVCRGEPSVNSSFKSDAGPLCRAPSDGEGGKTVRSVSFSNARSRSDLDSPGMVYRDLGRDVCSPVNELHREGSDASKRNAVFDFQGQKLSEFCEKLLHDVRARHSADGKMESEGGGGGGGACVDGGREVFDCRADRREHFVGINDTSTCDGKVIWKDSECINKNFVGGDVKFSDDDVESVELNSRGNSSRGRGRLDKETTNRNFGEHLTPQRISKTGEDYEDPEESETRQGGGFTELGLHSSAPKQKENETKKSTQEDLGRILMDLNKQLEYLGVEKESERDSIFRAESGKSHARNFQSKSENLEDYSGIQFSEYSKSLNELTEKLSQLEILKKEIETSKSLRRLQNRASAVCTTNETGSSLVRKNPSFVNNVGIVKPQIAKKPVVTKKPAVPPKPKLDNNRVGSVPKITQESPHGDVVDAADGTKHFVERKSFGSPLSRNASSPSSSSSSPYSRSFTPSPIAAAKPFLVSPSLPCPVKMSSPHHSLASSSPSLDSSFTLSPSSPATPRAPFSSTKYKLVRPPSQLSPSNPPETPPLPPSSSSPFVLSSASPSSCPTSTEMSRRKFEKVVLPGKDKKSFKVYRLVSLDDSSPIAGESSSSVGASRKSSGNSKRPSSVEALPQRPASTSSDGKSGTSNTVRRALSKRYDLVTIVTKEEIVTLKDAGKDFQKPESRNGRENVCPDPPKLLNAAERLYYLLDDPHKGLAGGGDDDDGGECGGKRLKIDLSTDQGP